MLCFCCRRPASEQFGFTEYITMVTCPEFSWFALLLKGKTQRFLLCHAEQTKDKTKMRLQLLSETAARGSAEFRCEHITALW